MKDFSGTLKKGTDADKQMASFDLTIPSLETRKFTEHEVRPFEAQAEHSRTMPSFLKPVPSPAKMAKIMLQRFKQYPLEREKMVRIGRMYYERHQVGCCLFHCDVMFVTLCCHVRYM